MKTSRLLIVLTLGFGIVVYAVWRSSQTKSAPVKLVGFQDQSAPLPMPESGKPDMRFHLLSAWQANQVPHISRMDTPMGSENGALAYNAQAFWEMNEKRGGHHTGDDLNGIGGLDTDLGDPVYSAADALVIYAGEPSPGWGKTIILAHRSPDGQPLQTMYAHLDQTKVALGSLVGRGDVIGTVGTANGYYPAHLHFEIRISDSLQIGGGYLNQKLNYLDPTSVISSMHSADAEGVFPSLIQLAKLSILNPLANLEIENAEKFSELESHPE